MAEINDISMMLGSLHEKVDAVSKNVADMRTDVKEINKATIIHSHEIDNLKLEVAAQKIIGQDYLNVKNKGLGIFAFISVAGGGIGAFFFKILHLFSP